MKNQEIQNENQNTELLAKIKELESKLEHKENTMNNICLRVIEAEDKVKNLQRELEDKNEGTQINLLKENHREEIQKMEEKVKHSDWMYSQIIHYKVEDQREIKRLDKELEESKILIEDLESEIEEKDEIIASHEEALQTAKKWRERNEKGLKEEIENQRDEAYKYSKRLAEKLVREERLEETIMEEREKTLKISKELSKEQIQKEKLWKESIAKKSLPRTPIKLKIIKAKIKFQQLIEKTKHRGQELIARIEVRTK